MSVKNERLLHIALLLLLISPPPAESFIFTAIMTAVSFAYQAYNIINDAHDTYKKFAPQTTLDDVLDQAKRVEEKVDQVGAKLSTQISQAVDTIVTRIDDLNNIREGIGKLSNGVRRIDSLYRLFELYTAKRIRLNNHTLQDYIQQVTTVGALAPKDILSDIHELIIPSSGLRASFLHYIGKDAPTNDTHLCGRTTPQGPIYQVFRLIMVNEIRAFTMMTFAYAMNQVYQCESFEGEIDYAEYQLQTRASDYYEVFSQITKNVVNSIRTCDPMDGWIKGENFYEFERFKTAHVGSAKLFFMYYSHCNPGCQASWVKPERSRIEQCDAKYQCSEETRCHGNMVDCNVLQNPVTVCSLGPTGHRYQYFTTGEGTQGNDTDGCQGNTVAMQEKNNCQICSCTCVENDYKSRTLRTFSTREQVSDVAQNKAVIGVRFVEMENMMHIQIIQAEVLPEGRITALSIDWKPLEKIKFDEERTNSERRYVYYIDSDDGTKYDMEEVTDYVSFSLKKHVINIDDLLVPPGYVVTGVKFGTDGSDKDNQPIQLSIQASPFNYDSGKIEITDDNPSIWLTAADMVGKIPEYDKERSQIMINGTKNPLYESGEARPRSSPNSYIEVSSTSLGNDGGQTTIPLLDAQIVTGKPAFAAGGIGLYYKSISEEIAGFVAFRLFALDSMKNMQIAVLDQLDQFKEGVTEFKGCNDAING